MISRPLRSLLLNFLLAAAASADTIQIGTGTDNTPYVPTYGWYNFSWSAALYLKEEIGDTCVVTGLSYYVNEPFSFTTEPIPQASFPWTAGFENNGAMPPFWHEDFLSGSTAWTFRGGAPAGQPAAASRGAFNACFAGPAGARTRLVAPVIDLAGAAAPLLTFMLAQPPADTSADALRVHYRVSPTNDWTLVPGGEFTVPLAGWTRRSLALPSPSSAYYLAFEGVGAGGGGVCLDDVSVLTAHGTATGWSAEFSISSESIMKRLGSTTFHPELIRANFMRYDWVREEGREERRLVQQNWSPVLTGNPHNTPVLMGRLVLTNAPSL